MSDAQSLIVLGTTAPLALKVLGPTADRLGSELEQWADRRIANVQRIFANAAGKLGGEGLERPGGVAPRVLKEILDDGSYWDEELGAEYFGGILAASRNEDSRDDRGATLASLVSRMSFYQLRSHYVMYAHARGQLVGSGLDLGMRVTREGDGKIFLPLATWRQGMGFTADEDQHLEEIAQHCLVGLIREDLLGEYFAQGEPDILRRVRRPRVPRERIRLHGHLPRHGAVHPSAWPLRNTPGDLRRRGGEARDRRPHRARRRRGQGARPSLAGRQGHGESRVRVHPAPSRS